MAEPELGELAVELEGARRRPRLDDQIECLEETASGLGRVDAVGVVLRTATDHEDGVEAPAGDGIEHREFFGDSEGGVYSASAMPVVAWSPGQESRTFLADLPVRFGEPRATEEFFR